MDINSVPAYLQTFNGAVQSACWFWQNNDLNSYADDWNIEKLSIVINGGTNGLADRTARWNVAKKAMGVV